MRAGLVFILVSLVAGGVLREWRRTHEDRFEDLVASLEAPERADIEESAPRQEQPPSLPGGLPPSDSRPARRSLDAARSDGGPRPGQLDPDRADTSEWERLPGIGPALARTIVADREARGPFRGPEALLRVPGIGPRTLERIRPYLRPARGRADSLSAR
jgi:competence ComEA-like helix-hairpin-helix protein